MSTTKKAASNQQPVLPPMTPGERRLGRKIGKAVKEVLDAYSRGPVPGGFIPEHCHCSCPGDAVKRVPE